jgi:prepilin-type N-terminal cleavage/methylation domain-containing protein
MKKLGFTLLETMIYIALFGVLMSGALVTVYALLGSVASNQQFEAAYSEGLFINQKIAWLLSDAVDVAVVASGTLKIIRPDSTVFLTASSSEWWLTTQGGSALPVSSPEFTVSEVHLEVSGGVSQKPLQIQVQYRIADIPFLYLTYVSQ